MFQLSGFYCNAGIDDTLDNMGIPSRSMYDFRIYQGLAAALPPPKAVSETAAKQRLTNPSRSN